MNAQEFVAMLDEKRKNWQKKQDASGTGTLKGLQDLIAKRKNGKEMDAEPRSEAEKR